MSRTQITDRNCSIDVNALRPIDDFLLVKVLQKTQTSSGLVLAGEGIKDCCLFCEVVAVGSGCTATKTGVRWPISFKPGDILLVMAYAGEFLALREGEYRMIREHGIWARVMLDADFPRESMVLADIEPVGDRLLVTPDNEERTRTGSLFLPGGQNKTSAVRLGTVVKAGPGRHDPATGRFDKIQVRVNDRIVFVRYAGANVTVRGAEYRIIEEPDVHAIYEE